MLLLFRRDGVDVYLEYTGHIELRRLSGKEILVLAALTRHLMDQRDALCLGGNHVIIFRRLLQKRRCGLYRQLNIPENHKCANIKVIRDLADRQISLYACDCHRVMHGTYSSCSRFVARPTQLEYYTGRPEKCQSGFPFF